MARYRFITADLLTDTTLAELPFEDVSYSQVLNGPGAFSGKLPLSLKSTTVVAKPYRSTVTEDGPTGYWPLSDAVDATSAADVSGNGNNGTVHGGVTFDRAAAAFDGSSGYISVPAETYYSLADTGEFTVEVWVYLTDVPGVGVDAQIAKKGNNNNPEWSFYIAAETQRPTFQAWTGDSFTTYLFLDFQEDIDLNTWTHLSVTVTPELGAAYINGERVAQVPNAGTDPSTDRGGQFEIGAWAEFDDFFIGSIKQAAVYTSALTAERVLTHYNEGVTPTTFTTTTEKVTRTNLDPGRTALYVERDGVLVWGGIIWTVAADVNGYSLTVGAEGFWSYFRRRVLRTTKTYKATTDDQLAIVRDLINYVQSSPRGDIGVDLGAEVSGVKRDRTYYSYERTQIGKAVEDLAAVEGGFDFAVDVSYDSGDRKKLLRLSYPQRGSVIPVTLDIASNVEALGWNIDATQQATSVDALGAGDADAMLISTAADTSLDSYPLLEDTVSYKDVSVRPTLDAHASATLQAHRLPVEMLSNVTVRDLPVGSFGTGDTVKVRSVNEGGFLNLNTAYRISQWAVGVDNNGKESIKLDFIPLEAFSA